MKTDPLKRRIAQNNSRKTSGREVPNYQAVSDSKVVVYVRETVGWLIFV